MTDDLADTLPAEPYTVAYVFSPRELERFHADVLAGLAPDLWDYIANRITTDAVDRSPGGVSVHTRIVVPSLYRTGIAETVQ
jgi:hypothetical protein